MKEYFGINVEPHFFRAPPKKYVGLIDELGCGWIRLAFDFNQDFDEKLYDAFLSILPKRIRILGLITGTVPGTAANLLMPSRKFISPAKQAAKIAGFCAKIAGRYRRIRHWELLNEQNFRRFWIEPPDPLAYVAVVEQIAPELRKASPGCTLVSGGILGTGHDWRLVATQGYLDGVSQKLGSHVDAFAFHPYIPDCYVSFRGKGHYIKSVKKKIDQIRHRYPDAWLTEFGISKRFVKLTYTEIGEVYAGLIRYCSLHKMRIFIWTLTDMDSPIYSPLNPEIRFGLVDKYLNKRPSFDVLKLL